MNKLAVFLLLTAAGSNAVGILAEAAAAQDTSLADKSGKHGRRRSEYRRRSASTRRRRRTIPQSVEVPTLARVAELEKQVADLKKLVTYKPDEVACMGKRERDACHVIGVNQSSGITSSMQYPGICIKRNAMGERLHRRFDDCSMLEDDEESGYIDHDCERLELDDKDCTRHLWGFAEEFSGNHLYCAPTCSDGVGMGCEFGAHRVEIPGCRWWNSQLNVLMDGECRRSVFGWLPPDEEVRDKVSYCVETRLITPFCSRSPVPKNTNCE